MTRDKILGQLRYDFAQLGWVMAIWAGWIGTEAIAGWWRWHALGGAERHHFVVFFSDKILPLIGTVLVVTIAPALAFGHSLWRSDAFWRTRPLPVRHLYFSRVGYLVLAIGVIPFMVRFGVLTVSGVEFQLAVVHTAGWALAYLAPALALWGLAMLFPRWRFLVVAVVILAPMLLPLMWTVFSSGSPLGIGPPEGLRESQALVGLILLGAGGLLTASILYWQRRRISGILVLGLAVLGAFYIAMWWQVNWFEGKRLGSKSSGAAARVEVKEAEDWLVNGELSWKSAEVPDYHWIGRVDVDSNSPLVGPAQVVRRITTDQSPEKDYSAQQALGRPKGFVNGVSRVREATESIRIPLITPYRRLPKQWKVSGLVDAHWFGHERSRSIPLEPGARFFEDGILLVIDAVQLGWDYRNVQQHLSIAFTLDRVRAHFTGNEYWRHGQPGDPFQEWHLALRMPRGSDPQSSGFKGYLFGKVEVTGLVENLAAVHLPVFDKSDPAVPPLITEEMISKCHLIVLRPVYRETMSASFAGESGTGHDAPVDEAED